MYDVTIETNADTYMILFAAKRRLSVLCFRIKYYHIMAMCAMGYILALICLT